MNDIAIDRIEKQLSEYLIMQTNYAIMLTASWGAGKTHYLKNTFFDKAKDSGYQGIVVSLFGINSIDDIKDRIFLALFPTLGNKYVKASGTILKLILKSVDISTLFANNLLEAEKDLNKQKFDFLSLEKLLICFDDLERSPPEMLKENQILGYINSLVEDNNVKVIIVANEDKVDLGEIKEKTIGNTVHFSQDYEFTFENILISLVNPTEIYLKHLKDNKSLIYRSLINENNENVNYRTFNYFLAKYAKVCHYIQSGFKQKDLQNNREKILENILQYCLMICIEFKKGKISFRDKKRLEHSEEFALAMLFRAKDESKPKDYAQETIELYFPKNNFNFYESIYNYLTGGDYFDTDKFYRELCAEYNISNEVISEAYQAFNQLSHTQVKELSDHEYINTTRCLKNFALHGEYKIVDYITVFYFIMRNGNILNIKAQKLTSDLIRAMKKVQNKHQYISSLNQYYKPSPEGQFYEYSLKLYNEIEKINNSSLIREHKKYDEHVENDFKNDFQGLYDRMLNDQSKPFIRVTLSGVHPLTVYRVFVKADNRKKATIITLFRILYNVQRGNSSKQDYDFLISLEKVLQEKVSKHTKNVSGSLFIDLLNEVSNFRKDRDIYVY